jgi:hypothetical protein
MDILSDLDIGNGNHSNMQEEDLALSVYRILKGRRYLIVLDDIWTATPWDAVKYSFPGDKNGSRIMVTTRMHNVVLYAKPDSAPFHLNFLTMEES